MIIHTKQTSDKKSNKGFTLVELIICIAIIAILTGIGLVTVNLINSAKAKESSVTLDSEVTDLMTRAKSQVCVVDGANQPTYRFCIDVYQHSNGNYYVRKGYYNPAATDDADKYIFKDADNDNDGKGVSLSKRAKISYAEPNGDRIDINNSGDTDTVNHVYIVVDKDGSLLEGQGYYTFYKKNGNEVAELTVRKNGSHQLK